MTNINIVELLKMYYNNGVWLSLARALALGARGPEFKSLYPDLEKNKYRLTQQFILDMTVNHNAQNRNRA